MIARLLETLLFGSCLLTINLLVVAVTTLAGCLPSLLRGLVNLMRWFLYFSYLAYEYVLVEIHQLLPGLFEMKNPVMRSMLSTTFSLILFMLIGRMLNANIGWPLVVLACLHGLAVGLFWDDLDPAAGLRLGRDG